MKPVVARKKLIEVALPLEAINAASVREKSIRHGHPSTLHQWWARRPLAAARAVLFTQMVDDPSSRPERFSTEEAQSPGASRALPHHRGVGEMGQRDGCWKRRGRRFERVGGAAARTTPTIHGPRHSSTLTSFPRSMTPSPAAAPYPRGAAPRAGSLRQRPQPRGGAHQQGRDRDSAPVRRKAAGEPQSPKGQRVNRRCLEGRGGPGRGRRLPKSITFRAQVQAEWLSDVSA